MEFFEISDYIVFGIDEVVDGVMILVCDFVY